MNLEAAFKILELRNSPLNEEGRSGGANAACPCCPAGTELCVFTGSSAEGSGAEASTSCGADDESITKEVLRKLSTLELLNLFTALQGERVETYAGFNKAVALLAKESRVDEYPMLCGETTSIFSVLSRRIIEIKDILSERQEGAPLAKLLQAIQDKEREKLVLVAAKHLDILQPHLPAQINQANNMTLVPNSPDLDTKIASIEEAVSEIIEEVVASKVDLMS